MPLVVSSAFSVPLELLEILVLLTSNVSPTEEIPDSSVQNKNSLRRGEIKVRKNEIKLRKKGMKVRKSFFVPRWRFRNSYQGNGDLRLLQKSIVSFRVDIRAWRVADMTHQGGLDTSSSPPCALLLCAS